MNLTPFVPYCPTKEVIPIADFILRFLICNIFVSIMIGMLLIAKIIFRNTLTSRMQYNLWFPCLGMLAVPFMPIHPAVFPKISSVLKTTVTHSRFSGTGAVSTDWMNDFAISVRRQVLSPPGTLLSVLWLTGVLLSVFGIVRAYHRLRMIKASSLPLQNREILELHRQCLSRLNITADIPLYSTEDLESPFIAGLFKPGIYLPRSLAGNCQREELCFMLLHELQHYKHKDALSNILMNVTLVTYWFNPLIWFALKKMKADREIACDTSVLEILDEKDYQKYGHTLINFAEKISVLPFTSGIGGSMAQMKKRILNIVSYRKPSVRQRRKSVISFCVTLLLVFSFTPVLSSYASGTGIYHWNPASRNIDCIDLASCFEGCEGSFVFYDLQRDSWKIHNLEQATLRVSPNSTYKIYDALLGLEEGVITPENSYMAWDLQQYPFDVWNCDQTLRTAMRSSVNWYFQALDKQLGSACISDYVRRIDYGNQDTTGGLSDYWMESSLKISAIEQAELLIRLHRNDFGFSSGNVEAVKDALYLSTHSEKKLYGKTGTGRVNGQDINGWFVGYVETQDNTYFFTANISDDTGASGSRAADITMKILTEMGIWT